MERMENENPDRLSSLSDDLIVSILSHLPIKEVAQTCILSKRWRNLWAIVPSLCFDIHDWNVDCEKFNDFVGNFLLKRDGACTDTHIFRILCQDIMHICDSFDAVCSEANKWITYAVKHNVKILELSFDGYCDLDIPDCLFTCKTLEALKLDLYDSNFMELIPSTIHLPRLRNLNLDQINFCDDNLEKVILGCPNLQDLSMENCGLNMSKFSCHSVQRLRLVGPYTSNETISISAPCVQILVLKCHKDSRVILKEMPKVTQATLYINSSKYEREYNCHLFRSLSGVKSLDISSLCWEEILIGEMQKCPTFQFHSLKFLSLHWIGSDPSGCSLDTWSAFIKHCPNLEKHSLAPLEKPCEEFPFATIIKGR
ncbi:FBD-associated F-box protein [Rhynchospora pubera]|uniref:FBD-associated F-box protein n=1 Tax=Rhynchospora pubera TaxID=906938 RepID=A0AAV8DTN4_9POAL|nr:FBD-associated F-box protein [Rhynchospora pubera]KAJ4805019.1 FBD-associated F-box protein [Rhynchospora pubera]